MGADFIVAALAVGVLVLAISLFLPVIVRPLLLRLQVVDIATSRSSHEGVAVRGLGVGPWVALLIGGSVAHLTTLTLPTNLEWAPQLSLVLALCATLILSPVIGLYEDTRGLSIKARSVMQLLLGVLVCQSAFFVGELHLLLRILLFIFGIFFVSSFVNVANFMDGLNGISAFHGMVAGVVFAVCGLSLDIPWLLAGGLMLAAAFFGFLPWNLRGYGFLGDVGSYLLGGAIISMSWFSLLAGVPLLAAIAPTVIYFGDVGWTLAQRYRRGEKIGEAHKEHVYQRLQQSGFSHVQAALFTASFTLIACVFGLLSLWISGPVAFTIFLILGLATVAAYLYLPEFLKNQKSA